MLTLTLVLSLLGPVKPGPHPVGYRVMEGISTWYVAGDDGEPKRIRDYSNDELAASYLDSPVLARRNASPVRTRFPLVFIIQGNGQSIGDQAVLAEILASHGYEVATIPTMAVTSMEERDAKVEEQARAVEKALDFLKNDRVYLLGHSLGVRAAVSVAQRRKVLGIISLDGGIPVVDAKAKLPKLIHFYQNIDERVKTDLTVLRALPVKSLQLELLPGMRHHHFTTYGFASAADPEFAKKTKAGAEISNSLQVMVSKILKFLR